VTTKKVLYKFCNLSRKAFNIAKNFSLQKNFYQCNIPKVVVNYTMLSRMARAD